MSILYEILFFINRYENLKYMDKKKFTLIEPALEYLKNHIYDPSLKIDELHQLCGVSHTYFRKIFIKKVGISPKECVVEKRLSRAKDIIDSGEMNTVRELALFVGYQYSLYFG